jgi:hypothetical protein
MALAENRGSPAASPPIHEADLLSSQVGPSVGRAPVLVKPLRSLDKVYGLDSAAVDAAWRRFEPGTKDGPPVPVSVAIEMTFTLRD